MKLKIEVDYETADKIVLEVLKETMEAAKNSIKPITRKMKDFEKQDVKDAQEALNHLEFVYEYFGGKE